MLPTDEPIRFQRYNNSSGWEPVEAHIIAETAISLTVNGQVWLEFTCTPTNLEALAVGFLYNEGFIQRREEIAIAEITGGGTNVDVWLHHNIERPENWRRTSGCTGGISAAKEQPPARIVVESEKITPEMLLAGMEQLSYAQELYRETGGVHCSAISDGSTIQVQAEDIGRHNTLDKLAGRLLLDERTFHPMIVLTTGRVSSEMLQKSARMGAAFVISRTSPTSLSAALADQLGVTLVGYARRNGFLVYAHPERIARE